ncbi:MAG TPA: response regulator [Gemmatimonadaceae bacterium]|jgi:DNA-binding response OmpR family regulator|nr:response regulator [Gemmatimonadaceae bacterium]
MAKGHILLAHGNRDCQTIYGSVLVYEGFQVDIAEDADSAIRKLSIKSYDLVVADLYLESTDDECLVRRLRRDSSLTNVPVVVLTGWTTEAHRQIASDADADDFLALPTRPRDLVDAVVSLLSKPRRQTPPGTARDRDDRSTAHEI